MYILNAILVSRMEGYKLKNNIRCARRITTYSKSTKNLYICTLFYIHEMKVKSRTWLNNIKHTAEIFDFIFHFAFYI